MVIDKTTLFNLQLHLTSIDGINKSFYSSFLFPNLLGLAHDYSNLSNWLNENLVEEFSHQFRRAESQCILTNFAEYADKDLGGYFKRGYESLNDPVPSSVIYWTGIDR